jgi:hypothetical protein
VLLHEHRHSLKEGLLEKSKLPHHAYEEGHRVGWDETRIWKFEVTTGIENNKSNQTTQFGHFFSLDPPYQQWG